MKCFCIYNGKGGVGKTILTAMFASYLQYHEKCRVAVIELERPVCRMLGYRMRELEDLNKPGSQLSAYFRRNGRPDSFFDILPWGEGVQACSGSYLSELNKRCWDFAEGDGRFYDYVLVDFPANFLNESEAYELMDSGLFDHVFVPISTHRPTWEEALRLYEFLKACSVSCSFVWNNISKADIARKGFIAGLNVILESHGIESMPGMVQSFVKAGRESSDRFFVNSTVCWPQRFVELNCPSMLDLFRAMKVRVDGK